jgi:metal-responsive CopG/Arc/MetJ family transcriptional regulator
MKEKNLKRTTIMAEEDMLYKIEHIARREGKSKAAVIREALVAYVTTHESEQPVDDPLLRLIGLAGETAVPTNMADGQDETDIIKNIDPRYGFALRDEKDAA